MTKPIIRGYRIEVTRFPIIVAELIEVVAEAFGREARTSPSEWVWYVVTDFKGGKWLTVEESRHPL